jgi:hypothetical protein
MSIWENTIYMKQSSVEYEITKAVLITTDTGYSKNAIDVLPKKFLKYLLLIYVQLAGEPGGKLMKYYFGENSACD